MFILVARDHEFSNQTPYTRDHAYRTASSLPLGRMSSDAPFSPYGLITSLRLCGVVIPIAIVKEFLN